MDSALAANKPEDLWTDLKERTNEYCLLTLSLLPSTDLKLYVAKNFQAALTDGKNLSDQVAACYTSKNTSINPKTKKALFQVYQNLPNYQKLF